MDFYHDLAPFYDQMISFDERLIKEKEVFHNILLRYPAKTALDAGCGSGFHSILLSKLGLKVTGIDISEDMLNLAESNAKKFQVHPQFRNTDFLHAAENLGSAFEAIYCLGNSFVHLLTEEAQLEALRNFNTCLEKKGYLCVQVINYDKFLHEKKKELSVKKIGNTIFTRTYEYHEQTITFHVQVEKPQGIRTMFTELYPLRRSEFITFAEKAGFDNIEEYGSLNLDPFRPLDSENCCIFCRKA